MPEVSGLPDVRERNGGSWRLVRRRVSAYLLDIALLFLVLGPVGWLTQRALGLTPSTGPQIWATLLLNFSFPSWLYFTVSDASARGATFGSAAGSGVLLTISRCPGQPARRRTSAIDRAHGAGQG